MKHYMLPPYGKNSWLRLLILFVLSNILMAVCMLLLFWAIVTLSPTIHFISTIDDVRLISVSPVMHFVISHIGLLIAFIVIAFLTSWLLKRPWYTVLTSRNKLQLRKIAWAFATFFCLLTAIQLIDFFMYRDAYTFNIDSIGLYIVFALLVVLLVPIQTTLEEFIFRGIGVQLVAIFTKSPLVIALIIGVIFGSLHFANPEMNMGALWVGLDYVVVGFFLTYMSVKFNATEYAIGAHAANNIFLCLFIVSDSTVGSQLPSMFHVTTSDATFWSFLIYTLLFNTVFYLLVRAHAYKHRQSLSQHDVYL